MPQLPSDLSTQILALNSPTAPSLADGGASRKFRSIVTLQRSDRTQRTGLIT